VRAFPFPLLGSLFLLVVVFSLAGCGSNPSREGGQAPEGSGRGGYADGGAGSFANNPAVWRFAQFMQSRYGYDAGEVKAILARAQRQDWIIAQMDKQRSRPPAKSGGVPIPNGSWSRYRAKFITPDNIDKGVAFWNQYRADLERAAAKYGVPPEIIVGIIGVETRWGRIMGKTRIIDALATLSFAYPRRSSYFSSELADFLLMTREEGIDPFQPTGSFAGAMGYGQFMPSSIRKFAVDFNGDHHRTLWNPVDAIGSVANYFKSQGWRTGQPVAVRASGGGPQAALLKAGFDTRYTPAALAAAGLTPTTPLGGANDVSLLRLDVGSGFDYWFGLHNFYVITRYNHSTYYAMAVYQLGNAVKARVSGRSPSRVVAAAD
jgi:membrane-bound lytic murein transglycosylase B